ncbi:MAG TPA: hypothetical protein VHD55_00720 [Candidatus Paceibacterota bacterium]|nr:hypothetical protein [Candidatus Paceibacterota bacterium]
MNPNIWFYTFSTAAQVMAALAGLFAVFVVYKIQDFSQLIKDARSSLSRLIPYNSANTGGDTISKQEVLDMTDRELVTTLAELLVLETSQNGAFFSGHSETIDGTTIAVNSNTYDYFAALVDKKERILKRLIFVLGLSLGTICVCLVSLVLIDVLSKFEWFIWMCLALFIYTLWTIGMDIYKITLE